VWLGFPIVDPIVGLFITVAILFIVKDSATSIWRRMMDSVDPEVVEGIEHVAEEVPQVEAIGAVRARWVGHRVHGELIVRVPPDLSVAEAARVKERLYEATKCTLPKLERLSVETDPS
jgi:divalent metal cation (Fe/Co/Zn/Cd) transporter